MLLVSALYPNLLGSRFDGEYYTGRHRALAHRLLGARGLVELRIALGEAGLDGGPPPYWAISEMVFPDRATFDAAMVEVAAEVMGDAAHYTDVEPVLQISRLVQA